MNGYIKEQRVEGLQEELERIIEEADSQYIKKYFKSISKLPKEDQKKWFFTSNEVMRREKERVDPITVCTVIQTVCVVVITVVTVYNSVKDEYEEKEVKEKKCEDKEVQVPCNEKNL